MPRLDLPRCGFFPADQKLFVNQIYCRFPERLTT
jgi:hypothetical protein